MRPLRHPRPGKEDTARCDHSVEHRGGEGLKYPWIGCLLIATAAASAAYVEAGPWTAFVIFNVIMFSYGNRVGINDLCDSSLRSLDREKEMSESRISLTKEILNALEGKDDDDGKD